MLLGIDVGGTSTDGVLMHDGALVMSVKKPSSREKLAGTILEVLDELLEGRDPGALRRLVISTTLVTNLLATRSGPRTALILVPGRGFPSITFAWPRILISSRAASISGARLPKRSPPLRLRRRWPTSAPQESGIWPWRRSFPFATRRWSRRLCAPSAACTPRPGWFPEAKRPTG